MFVCLPVCMQHWREITQSFSTKPETYQYQLSHYKCSQTLTDMVRVVSEAARRTSDEGSEAERMLSTHVFCTDF